jgi:hypothetical protein
LIISTISYLIIKLLIVLIFIKQIYEYIN